VTDLKIGPGGSASVYVLHEGYVGRDGDAERVAGTVTLILDGDAVRAHAARLAPRRRLRPLRSAMTAFRRFIAKRPLGCPT